MAIRRVLRPIRELSDSGKQAGLAIIDDLLAVLLGSAGAAVIGATVLWFTHAAEEPDEDPDADPGPEAEPAEA